MADHPVQIIEGLVCLVKHRVQAVRQGLHRKAKDGAAVHRDGRGIACGHTADPDRVTAARAQHNGKRCGIIQLQNGGTGTVTEQHAGGAVGRVCQPGECLAADDKRVPPAQCSQQPMGCRSSVQKTGAGRVHIKGRAVFRQVQRRLYTACHARRGSG